MADNQPCKRLFNRAVSAAISSHLATKSPFLIEKEKNKKSDQAKKREEKHAGHNNLLTQEMNDFLRMIDEKKKRAPLKQNSPNNRKHPGYHQKLIESSQPTVKSWNPPENCNPNFNNGQMNYIKSKNSNLIDFTNFAGKNTDCNKYVKSAHYDFTHRNSTSISSSYEKNFDFELNSEPESDSTSSCNELNSFTDYSLPVFALNCNSDDASQFENKEFSRNFSSQNLEMPCDFKMSQENFKMSGQDIEYKKYDFTRRNSNSISSTVPCHEKSFEWELNSESESSSSCNELSSFTNFSQPIFPLNCKSNDVRQFESEAFSPDFSSQNFKILNFPSVSKKMQPIPCHFVSQSSLCNDDKIRDKNQLMQDCVLPNDAFNKYENDRIQNLIDEFL